MMLPTNTNSCHHTKTLSILILAAENTSIYEELRAMHIEDSHTSICA